MSERIKQTDQRDTDPHHTAYVEKVNSQIDILQDHLQEKSWSQEGWESWLGHIGRPELSEEWNERRRMAYWSAEYGLPGLGANGGLGMLSRDHYLQAVDNNQPGVFLGLLYEDRKKQQIETDSNGRYWQTDQVRPLPDPREIGMKKLDNLHINLNGQWGNGNSIDAYEYPIGNEVTSLVLLQVPGEVYPGENNSDARLWNNVVMGMGGARALIQMAEQGIIEEPPVYHLNESATALGALTILDHYTATQGDNEAAYKMSLERLRERTVLTNHTLVPAAEATFTREQCEVIFKNLKSEETKQELKKFIHERGGSLAFLDLSFYLAGRFNGVSQFHGDIASEKFPEDGRYGSNFYGNSVEFTGVTNGVYEKGWNPEMVSFLEGKEIIDEYGMTSPEVENRIDALTTEELREMKDAAVAKLRQYLAGGNKVDQFGNKVDLPENAIIVGDARRYADYKRRWMLFQDPARLRGILTEEGNDNVHIIIAGKAHPKDEMGKAQLKHVLETVAGDELFKERVHVISDYDPELMQHVGPATHVWQNTPRVGEEACGTSGMKTGLGGALQVSTHDGFYAEMPRDSYYSISGATNTQEEFDSYYNQLKSAIADAQDSQRWADSVKKMWKGGILDIASGSRMLRDYTEFYLPEQEEAQAVA